MPHRILIVKLSSLGDVIHTLPGVQAVRRRFPHSHIAWAVERAHAGVIRGSSVVDELIEWDRGTWRGMFDFARRLRAQRWDLAVDFQGLMRSAIVTRLSGARRRLGFAPGREHSHLLYNEFVPTPTGQIHAVDRSLRLVDVLGASFEGLPLERRYLRDGSGIAVTALKPAASQHVPDGEALFPLPLGAAERGTVDDWLSERRFDVGRGDRLVVLNPHCRKEANIWPAAQFAALAGRLLDAGLRVAVTGGPVAKSLCDEIAAPHGDRVWRADGAFSLLGSAELIHRASLFVTGDTGPMHIAAAVGTPIVALFGPADPARTGPYAADAVVLTKNLSCAPCFARHCPLKYEPAKCMTDITVEDVLAASLARLEDAEQALRRRSA